MKKSSSNWPVSYKFLATGTLMMYTAVGCSVVQPALAQQPTTVTKGRESSVWQFDITPAPLGTALDSFEHTSGIHVILSNAGIRELHSPGVAGAWKAEKALGLLLTGTGVEF